MLALKLHVRKAAVFSAVFGVTLAAFAMTAEAQEGDADLGADAWQSAACKQCHGWAGDGVPEDNQQDGVSLRETLLTAEFLIETIRCGRPGTGMPSFRRNAWTEIIPCYGLTQPPEGAFAPAIESPIGDRTINNLVAFILRDFAGQGPVSREYCWLRVGPDSTRCDGYPTEAEIAAAAAGGGG